MHTLSFTLTPEGVTYKLTYEGVEVMHALFNKHSAKNTWTIGASTLRSFVEYFGANTEYLDISSESGRATFMSYTEKVMNGRDNLDFEDFTVEDQLHIGISVKDFKAIVTHAETLKTSITALYSFPTRPLQLSYSESGMICEFTLMTIGEYRGGSVTPAPAAARQVSAAPPAPVEKPPSRQSTAQAGQQSPAGMPPPSQPASRSFTKEPQSQRTQRPSPPPPKASMDPDSLFLPAEEDEDRVWGEKSFDDEEDVLGWNASASNVRTEIMSNAVYAKIEWRLLIPTVHVEILEALRGCSLILHGAKIPTCV
ncbi:hypothetical protein P7C71_g2562, partial [Lecanoromycetidae sp. Uapishka_2]